MGLRPKPWGGFAARVLLRPPWRLRPTPRWGLPPPDSLLNGVWGGAQAGVWGRSLQQRSCGEAAPGFGAEPLPPRPPWPPSGYGPAYLSCIFSDSKVYKCQCGRGFYRYTDLLYHKHPGEDDEPEEWDPETFKPKHPLKVYSEESRPYICQYCGKAYANSRDLKFHIYSHRGERAFNVNVQASRYLMTRSGY